MTMLRMRPTTAPKTPPITEPTLEPLWEGSTVLKPEVIVASNCHADHGNTSISYYYSTQSNVYTLNVNITELTSVTRAADTRE